MFNNKYSIQLSGALDDRIRQFGLNPDQPFVLLNRRIEPHPKTLAEVFATVGPLAETQLVRCFAEAVDAYIPEVSKDELTNFRRGQPLIAKVLPHPDELRAFEIRARAALAHTVMTCSERLVGFGDLGASFTDGLSRIFSNSPDPKNRLAHLYEEGLRAAEEWYPGQTDIAAIKAKLRVEGERSTNGYTFGAAWLEAYTRELHTVSAVNKLYRHACGLVELASSLHQPEETMPADHAWIARSPITVTEAGIAAFYGDLDPTHVCPSLFRLREAFQSLRERGRRQRAGSDSAANAAKRSD